MPTWDDILKECDEQLINPYVLFKKYVSNLNKETNRTVICYMTAFTSMKPPVPGLFHSIIDSDIQGFMTCVKDTNKDNLDLILHTPGGDSEATKRIINYIHSIYGHIRVFIPHMAMSGGTLIACAADEIYMGPYSSLGPTDPQVFIEDRYIPIRAILNEFSAAFEEVTKEPQKALLWVERLKKIPFGIIKNAENIQNNSLNYLKELLKQRNCKDKTDRIISDAAEYLSSHEKHSSHGSGISLNIVRNNLQLTVHDLSKDKELEDAVLSIYHAASIMFDRTPVQKIIINHMGRAYLNKYPL